jgi:threonine dehydrogenase-like Zn-dependent dehydrogenase
MFTGPGLVIPRQHECELETVTIDEDKLQPGELILETECSIISAGTEVANYTALDPGVLVPGRWNSYPYRPGYGAVGTVVACGPARQGDESRYKVGDKVFAITRHARFSIADPERRPAVHLRADDDAKTMVLARMASVAISAVRKSSRVELGGRAAVVGLGLVGNFAAQLLQLSGMDVVGLDRASHRVEMAEATGLLAKQVGGAAERETVWSAFGGDGPDLVVEASGVPDAVSLAVHLARDGGEVILLGSPRGEFRGDATAVFSEAHHRGIHVVGALEWLLPLRSAPWQARWSLYDDYTVLFNLFRKGKIRTDKLVSHVVAPHQAQAMYSSLAENGPSMGAVLFDWRAV